ncbi:MAG: (Fe-S)-binding protein [Candidatus Bathyarchaeia archaeon]
MSYAIGFRNLTEKFPLQLKALDVAKVDDVPYACTQCGHCNAHCPTGNELRWELGSPRGKIFFTKWLRDHGFSMPLDFIQRIFQCTMCGRCHTECMADLDTIGLWAAIRGEIGRRGLWPRKLQGIVRAVRETANVYGRPNSERLNWAGDVKDKIASRVDTPANVAYFVGCMASFNPKLFSIPENMVKILEAAKANYTVLGGEEWCSCTPMTLTGVTDVAIRLAEHNAAKLEGLGVDTVVAPCAGCYRALKVDYPKIVGPMSFRVVHSSEFILELLNAGKIKPSVAFEKTVAYHDPCLLGRHCNVYQQPRDVLAKLPGVKYVEMVHNREDSHCSGAGGFLKALYPQLAADIGGKLLDGALEVGGNVLASACPNSELNLSATAASRKLGLQIMDLVEVVGKTIP